VFLNAIVYMQRYDGARPLVKKTARSRQWMRKTIGFIDMLDGMEEEQRAGFEEYLRDSLPAEVVDEHGLDPEALLAWYAANEDYLTVEGRYEIVVDELLRELELPNHTPAFLDWVAARLGEDPGHAEALFLARKYLDVEDSSDAAAILAWLEENRARLFFSDTGGYRWFVDTREGAAGERKVGAR
jgi:hypothetical protein